jgi:hypothetical protein
MEMIVGGHSILECVFKHVVFHQEILCKIFLSFLEKKRELITRSVAAHRLLLIQFAYLCYIN